MQKILGYMRKAINEFGMLENGDRIAVGISGGKDSLVLLKGLAALRSFIGIDYELNAVTIDPYFGGKKGGYEPVRELCRDLAVSYTVIDTRIGEIVFDARKEPNPCSLCSRMRRGALLNAAKELGCSKVALGHNFNDAVETFVMNLTMEGRLGCFSPVCTLDNRDITIIRPLVLAPEKDIKSAAVRNALPVVKSQCPADGSTARQRIKEELAEYEKNNKGVTVRIFGALRRSGLDGWGINEKP